MRVGLAVASVILWIVGCLGLELVAAPGVTPLASILVTSGLDFASMCSVIGTLPYRWPAVNAVAFAVFSASSLNIQGLACATTFDTTSSTALTVLSPWILWIAFGAFGGLRALIIRLRGKDVEAWWRTFKATLSRVSLFIFIICFTTIATTSYRAFLCIAVDGTEYLRSDVAIVCNSAAHSTLKAWASVGLAQIFIFPILMAVAVQKSVNVHERHISKVVVIHDETRGL